METEDLLSFGLAKTQTRLANFGAWEPPLGQAGKPQGTVGQHNHNFGRRSQGKATAKDEAKAKVNATVKAKDNF